MRCCDRPLACRSVHRISTTQLLRDVPSQPAYVYQTYSMGGNETVRMRMRSAGQEWWDARSWGRDLQSMVVRGHR